MYRGSYFIRMANKRDWGVTTAALRAFEKSFGLLKAASEDEATVIVTNVEAEAIQALQSGQRVLFVLFSDFGQLPPAIASGYEGRVGVIGSELPSLTDIMMALGQLW